MLPVVILAGGLATRLGSLTQTLPKCLIDVNGEPFLFHQLRGIHSQGVRHAMLCVGHLGEQVVAAAGDGAAFGLSLDYSFDGTSLLGTAGAVKKVVPRIDGPFFVLYGDSYLACDFSAVLSTFRSGGKPALMTVFANNQLWDVSNVEFSAGQIVAYDKVVRTSSMRHIDYGLGAFDPRAFDEVPVDQPFDLARLYQKLLVRRELAAHEVFERFYEVGSPAGLEETRSYLASSRRTLSGSES